MAGAQTWGGSSLIPLRTRLPHRQSISRYVQGPPPWVPLWTIALWLVANAMGVVGRALEPDAAPDGDAVIRARFGSSDIVITTTNRLAGAIHSLHWDGQEFIDSYDHGRQLQSAASFDCAASGEFWSERYNPTEAGTRADGTGPRSSSRLLKIAAQGNVLSTTTRMAFWLAPGEDSVGRSARNDRVLSHHELSKQVRIGYKNLANVIEYHVTFHVPPGERHHHAVFEALTGYMPAEFERFWAFRPSTQKLEPLGDGPGEQAFPVVLAQATGTHAMGVFSPDQPSRGFEELGYGRFRFTGDQVVKWNCVFRIQDSNGISPGEYRFRVFVAVGTLDDVRRSLSALISEFGRK